MLYIVASYHCMQFQGKLINQTWKNDKKPSFEPDFGPFGPNLGTPNFFYAFYIYQILDSNASYHCMQFEGKLMNQTWENGQKPSFGADFGLFGPNLVPQFFL